MADYVQPGIVVDPDELAQGSYDAITARFPNWDPAEGSYEAFLVEVFSQLIALLMQVCSDVPPAVFRYFGKLIGIPPLDATPASVDATVTVQDDAGYTIPAGTLFAIPASGDTNIPFTNPNAVVIPPGSTSTGRGEVALVAQTDGSQGTGLAGPPQLVDTLTFVTGVVQVGLTEGGQDAEDDDTYLNRLAAKLRLLIPRPVYDYEYAQFAQTVPGVYRAVAFNLYNPADDTSDNPGMVAVALQDITGAAVTSIIRDAVVALLAPSGGVLGITVNLMDPTYTVIRVIFNAVAFPGYDPATVQAAAEAAVLDFLDRAKWGSGQPGTGQTPQWLNVPTVRFQDISTVLNNVEGLDYWTSLTVNGGTSDVTMSGKAPLPDAASTCTGTVRAP